MFIPNPHSLYLLAESASVKIQNQVNVTNGQSYSVTTTTINGQTTTEEKTYSPEEPVIVSISAVATGTPHIPTPSPVPTVMVTPPPIATTSAVLSSTTTKPISLYHFVKSAFSTLFRLFVH